MCFYPKAKNFHPRILWCLGWQYARKKSRITPWYFSIWHETWKEAFAINQHGTCCGMSRLGEEIRNSFPDMISLRNVLDIQWRYHAGACMDKSRVQGERERWGLKPCHQMWLRQRKKETKDRILEAPPWRACRNKEQSRKKTGKEQPIKEVTKNGVHCKWREVSRWRKWSIGSTVAGRSNKIRPDNLHCV